MGRRTRGLSYVIVAVLAFAFGSASPASADNAGGLTALVAQVQTLATNLTAEIARAAGAETALADAARANQLFAAALSHSQQAHEQADKAHELLDQERQDANQARQDALKARLDQVASGLVFEAATRAIQDDISLQKVKTEQDRATAAEDRLRAQQLLDEAASKERDAATLEQAAGYTDRAVAGVKLTNLGQLAGLTCVTRDGHTGHVVAVVGPAPDYVIALLCQVTPQ